MSKSDDDDGFAPGPKLMEALAHAVADAEQDTAAHMTAVRLIRMVDQDKNGEIERIQKALKRIEHALFEIPDDAEPSATHQQQLWFSLVVLGVAMDHVANAALRANKNPFKFTVLTMYHIAMIGNEDDAAKAMPTAGNA